MLQAILNCKDEISLIANIVTILAFILAIMAFLNWKKEQKHAKKLDYTMELEDKFEILIRNIEIEFAFFCNIEKILINTDQKSKEYKDRLSDFIKDELQKYKNEQSLGKDFYEYNLALLRVKRFLKNIDTECTALDYPSLKKLNEEAIKLTPKWIDENTISNESNRFLERVHKIHEEGLSHLKKKYK